MRDLSFLLQTETGVQDLTPVVTRFVYRNSLLLGRTVWVLQFASPKWEFWQNFMIGKGYVFNVKIKASRESEESETPWLSLVVDQSKGMIKGGRILGTVVGGGGELQMMNQTKRRAFYNMTITNAIQQIASDNGLVPSVGSSTARKTWYQANQTDWEFLQEELMPYFVPASSNRGDAFLNVEGRNLTAKTIEFAAPSTRLYNLSNANEDDRVVAVYFHYYGGQVDRGGGIVAEVRGFNPSTGTSVLWTVQPGSSSQPALAPKLPKRFAALKQAIIDPHSSLEFIKARALREQAKNGTRYYGVSVEVVNDLTVKLRDMFEISMRDEEGLESPYHGRYGVYEVIFDYKSQGVNTTIVGFRKEAYKGEQVSVGADLSRSRGKDLQKTKPGRSTFTKTAVEI